MTELMKRYEAETGKCAATVDGWGNKVPTMDFMDWKDNYIIKLRAEAYDRLRRPCDPISLDDFLKESSFVFLFEKFMLLQAENALLRDQLTWRPVSEKPEKDCQCFVSLADGGMVIIGMWKSGELCIEEKYRWLGVKSWLPIPPQGE